MYSYKFDKNYLSAIMSHIDAYGFTILSMATDGEFYTITLNNVIPPHEVSHLQESFQLEVV